MRWVATLAAAAISLASTGASALTFVIANGAAQIYLRIGQTGGTVPVVTIDLTGSTGILGNGTPVLGTVVAQAGAASGQTANFPACPANYVRLVARARSTAAAPRTATFQVNSSTNLVHAASGNTMPFTQIGWVSDDAVDLPAGTFTGAAGQLLATINTSREVGACHRFQFMNTQIFPASTGGTGYYQGTVVYNLNMP
jgi:hypothetical protein